MKWWLLFMLLISADRTLVILPVLVMIWYVIFRGCLLCLRILFR